MAEMIIGLSQSNTQMKTTLRYLDQIQRSTDRLNRVRYQGLIKVNNELRMTGRRLESIYSTAVRLSRLRITPRIGLDDQLSPALDRALIKLNSFRNQLVKASGTVSVEVKQKVEVAMGKMPSASASSMSVVIGSNNTNTTINNVAKEEDKAWWENVDTWLNMANNATDLIGKGIKVKEWWSDRKDKKNKAANPSASTEAAEDTKRNRRIRSTSSAGGETSQNTATRRVAGGRGRRGGGSRVSTPVSVPTPSVSDLVTDTSDRTFRESLDMNRNRNRRIGSGRRSNLVSGIMSSSPMGMSNLFSGDGMLGKLGGGFAKGAKKLLGPISMLADVANIANAPAEERGRAVGSMIGGTAGTAIGSAIGSFILPGIGTYIGGAVGGWAGGEVGGWIGDKAKDIGSFVSNASEGLGNALSGAADFVSEKAKSLTEGFSNFFGFGSKKEEQTTPPATVASTPSVPAAPQMPPAYRPEFLSITGPEAYMNNRLGSPTSAGLMGTSVMQSQAMALNQTGQQGGKASPLTVSISEEQMSSLAGYLKDFKTETTNQISVNVAPGTVQVTVRENAIDYDAVTQQVGQRISNELRRAMQNRKTIMA